MQPGKNTVITNSIMNSQQLCLNYSNYSNQNTHKRVEESTRKSNADSVIVSRAITAVTALTVSAVRTCKDCLN